MASSRVLWLAMRDFLLDQAAQAIQEMTGQYVSVEKGSQTASGTRIVMGSVQTLKGKRLERWPRDSFDLIVFDEAHHAVAPGPRKIFDHFETAKILGLTGTPQRLDNIGLGNVFGAVSVDLDAGWGRDNGYLVPVRSYARPVQGIDLSAIDIVAGDLKLSDLEKEIVEAAAPIAQIAWEESEQGELPSLIYTPGVASAQAVSRAWNVLALSKYGYDTSASVDQDTKAFVRREILANFGQRLRAIVNCLVYTEGLDVPQARNVVIARMTASISLYQQMGLRGARPEGWIGQLKTAAERIEAIAKSSKPWFKLVDITGKAGKHSLVTAAEALAGKGVPADVAKLAKEIIKKAPGIELDEAMRQAQIEKAKAEREESRVSAEKAAKASALAKVSSIRTSFDAFKRLGADVRIKADGIKPAWLKQRPTPEQIYWMRDNKLAVDESLTRADVAKLQKQLKEWRRFGKASFKQRNVLAKFDLPVDVPLSVARRLINALAGNQWSGKLARKQTDRILSEGRTVGEEG